MSRRSVMYRLLKFVPKNHLSQLIGSLVHAPLPKPIARRAIRWFARAFHIDVESASQPIDHYGSIGAFFVRDLKDGLRPIEGDLVSPVDGTLRSYGHIVAGRLEQVKDKSYSLAAFLSDPARVDRFESGFFFNLYLSPQDYHHVHSPVAGRIVRSVHIPGRLWPVNDWSLRSIEDLFSINERVVTYLESERYGNVAVIMIGATNVGKMSVTFDTFVSNASRRDRRVDIHDYPNPVVVKAGDRLGTFHMGSSVVLLFEKGRIEERDVVVSRASKLKYGQALIGKVAG